MFGTMTGGIVASELSSNSSLMRCRKYYSHADVRNSQWMEPGPVWIAVSTRPFTPLARIAERRPRVMQVLGAAREVTTLKWGWVVMDMHWGASQLADPLCQSWVFALALGGTRAWRWVPRKTWPLYFPSNHIWDTTWFNRPRNVHHVTPTIELARLSFRLYMDIKHGITAVDTRYCSGGYTQV